MQKENKVCDITPANRVNSVQEYYFSRKLKEVAEMNAAGKHVINLGVGSPDLPPRKRLSKRFANMPAIRRSMVTNLMSASQNCEKDLPIGTKNGTMWSLTRRRRYSL